MDNPTTNYSSCKVWTYCLTITLSSFYFGYNVGAFNGAMDDIAEALHWGDKKSLYTTMFTAAFPLGAMMSTMFAGKCTDRFGRRKTLMGTCLVGIAVHCFNVIPNTWTFGISRLLAGALSGFMSVIPPLFLNEVSPTSISGRTGTLVGIQITLGIVAPGLFALALPTEDYSSSDRTDLWMFIFGFPVVFLLFQFLLFLTVVRHESPVWSLKKGRNEEAKAFYRFIYSDADNIEYNTMQAAINPSEMNGDPVISDSHNVVFTYKSFFTQRKFRKMLHLAVLIQLLWQWSGVNAIFSYSATMFDFGVFMGRVFSAIIAVVNCLATCVSVVFVDKFGRKPMLIFGTLGCALALAATGFSAYFNQPYAAVVFVVLYVVCFEQSLGPVVWIFCGEVLYDGAMGVSVMTNWTCYFILVLVFPYLRENAGIHVCFWIFAVICALGVVYFWAYIIETKGRKKNENQQRVISETK
jgi:sugar porter (SP) family MFS transporter